MSKRKIMDAPKPPDSFTRKQARDAIASARSKRINFIATPEGGNVFVDDWDGLK